MVTSVQHPYLDQDYASMKSKLKQKVQCVTKSYKTSTISYNTLTYFFQTNNQVCCTNSIAHKVTKLALSHILYNTTVKSRKFSLAKLKCYTVIH